MDEHKICFIYCADNESQLMQSLAHINMLNIPAGFVLENRIVRGAASIASGYNHAMCSSDAKYKIYLHQDVNILYPNILYDCLSLFNKNSELGLLGVLGVKKLPSSGIFWGELERNFGKSFHFGVIESTNEVLDEFESVQAIDGLIMITQYDLPWREDLFKGWHYYDLSQSLEFIKAGFLNGVPRQPRLPWCSHDCIPDFSGYEEDRQTFLREYGCFLT